MGSAGSPTRAGRHLGRHHHATHGRLMLTVPRRGWPGSSVSSFILSRGLAGGLAAKSGDSRAREGGVAWEGHGEGRCGDKKSAGQGVAQGVRGDAKPQQRSEWRPPCIPPAGVVVARHAASLRPGEGWRSFIACHQPAAAGNPLFESVGQAIERPPSVVGRHSFPSCSAPGFPWCWTTNAISRQPPAPVRRRCRIHCSGSAPSCQSSLILIGSFLALIRGSIGSWGASIGGGSGSFPTHRDRTCDGHRKARSRCTSP